MGDPLLRAAATVERPNEAWYRQLVANLPHAVVFAVDEDLRLQLVEGSGRLDTGYGLGSIKGKLLSEVMPPGEFAELEPIYRAALRGHAAEFDRQAGDGRILRTRVRPMLDDADRIVGALVVAEDVTAERAVQDEREQAHAFSAAVLAAAPDLLIVADLPDGQSSWSSGDVGQLLGWPSEPTGGVPALADMVVEEDLIRLTQTNAAVALLPDGQTLTSRFRLKPADSRRWISRQSTPFRRSPDGRVQQILSVIRDITDVVEVERRMEHAALHDALTELPNRALLMDRLTSALARATRLGAQVPVLFLDLDGFKQVNDVHGHAAGDAVLIEMARRLSKTIRNSDTVARVGGDEFVVVLEPMPPLPPPAGHGDDAPDSTLPPHLRAVTAQVADRIRTELNRSISHEGRRYTVSVSIGVTYSTKDSGADDVLRDADAALYRAKQRGRNRVEVFDERHGADIGEQERVQEALRGSLRRRSPAPPTLSVAYQPVYDLAHRELVGFEALARLVDRDGLAINPEAFIPVAQDIGLVLVLGSRVLDDALDSLVQWRAGHPDGPPATIAVNLSAREVQHSGLPKAVHAALRRHRLPADALVLEVRESVLLAAGSSTLSQLTELREAGVGITIDNFGTGDTSLRYLATLPASCIKVDRSLTSSIPADDAVLTVVSAVSRIAVYLGIGCVVGGIESEEQLALLPPTVMGQGFLLGRPAPALRDAWSAVADSALPPAQREPDPADALVLPAYRVADAAG